MNDRIINQYALFSIISDPNATVDDWAKKHLDICRKIIIPASLKWEVRDKLDQSNITEHLLFPGLNGLTSWIKKALQCSLKVKFICSKIIIAIYNFDRYTK